MVDCGLYAFSDLYHRSGTQFIAFLRLTRKGYTMNIFKQLFSSAPATDFAALVKNGALIIDVRTPGEFADGHIKGSTNIPLDVIAQNVSELKRKNKVLITVCRSGNRSGSARAILEKEGIEVYNGGAWHSLKHKI
jgi:rhodanese-related sulfurtransferase